MQPNEFHFTFSLELLHPKLNCFALIGSSVYFILVLKTELIITSFLNQCLTALQDNKLLSQTLKTGKSLIEWWILNPQSLKYMT